MNGTNGKQSDFPDVALVPYPVIVAATDLKILIKRINLSFLMQGKVGKRYFLCSAPPDFLMGVAGFVVQHPFTETLKDTLLLKFHAIRFHVLTSFRVER